MSHFKEVSQKFSASKTSRRVWHPMPFLNLLSAQHRRIQLRGGNTCEALGSEAPIASLQNQRKYVRRSYYIFRHTPLVWWD